MRERERERRGGEECEGRGGEECELGEGKNGICFVNCYDLASFGRTAMTSLTNHRKLWLTIVLDGHWSIAEVNHIHTILTSATAALMCGVRNNYRVVVVLVWG